MITSGQEMNHRISPYHSAFFFFHLITCYGLKKKTKNYLNDCLQDLKI